MGCFNERILYRRTRRGEKQSYLKLYVRERERDNFLPVATTDNRPKENTG